ncbi:MAG: hypothetical protein BGP16_00885 [Sphingobium sp. 66-54]|nr:MAG: hypothetical protein BGP16_00885 [Sphingobium sp. 66-54]
MTDDDYTKIVNENALNVTRSADPQENSTKEEGRVNNPGDESWEIGFDFNEIYEDAGFTILDTAFNVPWAWQIRDVSRSATKTDDTVWLEGEFLLSQLEFAAESTDVRSGSGTLNKSGTVTMNIVPRELVTE